MRSGMGTWPEYWVVYMPASAPGSVLQRSPGGLEKIFAAGSTRVAHKAKPTRRASPCRFALFIFPDGFPGTIFDRTRAESAARTMKHAPSPASPLWGGKRAERSEGERVGVGDSLLLAVARDPHP